MERNNEWHTIGLTVYTLFYMHENNDIYNCAISCFLFQTDYISYLCNGKLHEVLVLLFLGQKSVRIFEFYCYEMRKKMNFFL